MASTFYDMVQFQVSGIPGTGIITSGAPLPGFRNILSAGIPDGTTVSYIILDALQSEYGRGVTGGSGVTLTRGPIWSTIANAAINASSTSIVLLSVLAEDLGSIAQLNVGTGLIAVGSNLNINNQITASGPIGSSAVVPIITYNAQGQLTTVTNATIRPAITQRSVTSTTITIVSADSIINCNISSSGGACALPSASSRAGAPLIFKDLGHALAHPITLTAAGGDTIDGATTFVIAENYFRLTLVPFNDTVNSGWSIF